MLFKRKIYDKLLEWKNRSHGETALLIEGARRVGTSTIVEEFGRREYKSVAVIDFMKPNRKVVSAILEHPDDLNILFTEISLAYNVELYERNTLIVFDEVQRCPQARELIKALVADGRYHYLETGSLISVKKNTAGIVIPSEELHCRMHPMDFEEFLRATGRDSLMDAIRTFFAERRPLGAAVHRRAMEAFRQYLVVGGMPQAVAEFAASHDLREVDLQKRAILGLYRDDIWKHAGAAAPKIERIFDEIPSQLSRHEKKFRIGDLGEGAKMRDWADAFQWLESAMFANRCWNSTEPNVGLKMNLDSKSVKCYLADTGLLVSHAFDESELVSENVHRRILLDRIALNEGMLVENMAAQMLVAAGRKLYFHSESSSADSKSRMEIDFLVAKSKLARRHNVSPVEIKSGRNATQSSLDKFRRKYSDWCAESFLFWDRDVRVEGGVTYLPLYMLPLL